MIFFRLPFEENFYTVEESASADPAVTFVPFGEGETLKFYGKLSEISAEEILAEKLNTDFFADENREIPDQSKLRYLEKVERAKDFVKENHLPKIVLSRIKTVEFGDKSIHLTKTFLNLSKSYPNAFAYLFIKDGHCWLGAFSEVLGTFSKGTSVFSTMSLAGTLPLNEDWTPKEIEEQKPVTEYIADILSGYSENISVSETYDHISGSIKHLRTDFKINADARTSEKIVSELHPTPAVCGIPKDLCKAEIEKLEDSPRGFYAGYIKVEMPEQTFWFVNLRCAEITGNMALIHAGGGITSESSAEKEWRETEFKADAVLKNIEFEN